MDFPCELGSLARRKKSDARYVERFELYISGLELCNAFSELNDYEEQKARFVGEKRKRAEQGFSGLSDRHRFLGVLALRYARRFRYRSRC